MIFFTKMSHNMKFLLVGQYYWGVRWIMQLSMKTWKKIRVHLVHFSPFQNYFDNLLYMHGSQRLNFFQIVTDKGKHSKLHILVITCPKLSKNCPFRANVAIAMSNITNLLQGEVYMHIYIALMPPVLLYVYSETLKATDTLQHCYYY